MEIDIFCCIPEKELVPRIQENCANYPQRVRTMPAHDGAAVLVGGGPSMRDKVSSIRQRQELGQTIFALNGAAGFLNAHDIVPYYQVLLDPQKFLTKYYAKAAGYLVASQCHPIVLAACPQDPILWHIAMEGREEITPTHPEGDCLVGGGYTVGLTAMCLAYAMGYRKLHLYGYDSSVTEDGDHAYPCPLDQNQVFDSSHDVVVTVAGQKFYTTLALAKQAMEFSKVCDDLIDAGCLITVECGGLIRAIVDENIRLTAAKAA